MAEAAEEAPKRDRRTGRGQLSSMDMLPEEAQDDVVWAVRELNARQRSAEDIRFELNDRLDVKGLGPISRSAFNRKSVKLAAASTRLAEARHIFAGLADQFTPERADESAIVIGEMLKMLLFEHAQGDSGEHTPQQAMQLAQAYLAVIRGQAASADRRRKIEADFAARAVKEVERAAGPAGLSGDTVSKIKASILGIAPAPSEPAA